MDIKTLKISNPCSENFNEMEGEGHKRFCGSCEKHVHNLSDLSRAEAKALLAENGKSEICVVYRYDAAGKVVFQDTCHPRPSRKQLSGVKRLLAAAAMVPILAVLPACDVQSGPETVIEAPCDYKPNGDRPIDKIIESEQGFLAALEDFLGFTPEIEMVAGEMMYIPPEEPVIPINEIPHIAPTGDPLPEVNSVDWNETFPDKIEPPEQLVMGQMIAEPEPEPVKPIIPKPEPRKLMGKIAPSHFDR